MKLLLDQNLSRKLAQTLSDLYPGSAHVSGCELEQADDEAVWEYAKASGFTIVTKDTDFHQRCFLRGAPPQVVWIRLGNCTTGQIETLLRDRVEDVRAFGQDTESALLVLP